MALSLLTAAGDGEARRNRSLESPSSSAGSQGRISLALTSERPFYSVPNGRRPTRRVVKSAPVMSPVEDRMPDFIVNRNAQPNGDHEVHQFPQSQCPKYPLPQNQVKLGWHVSCASAVTAAKALGYTRANGCYHCANACHTG